MHVYHTVIVLSNLMSVKYQTHSLLVDSLGHLTAMSGVPSLCFVNKSNTVTDSLLEPELSPLSLPRDATASVSYNSSDYH